MGKHFDKSFLQDVFRIWAISGIPVTNRHHNGSVFAVKCCKCFPFPFYATLDYLFIRNHSRSELGLRLANDLKVACLK
jgi:hypothetical protein